MKNLKLEVEGREYEVERCDGAHQGGRSYGGNWAVVAREGLVPSCDSYHRIHFPNRAKAARALRLWAAQPHIPFSCFEGR